MTRRWVDAPANGPEAERVQALLRGADEAPPAGAQQRVWRRLDATHSGTTRGRRRWAGAVVAVAATAGAVLFFQGREPRGDAASGPVIGALERAPEVRRSWVVGTTVQAAAGERVVVPGPSDTLALLGPGTVLLGAEDVTLLAGRIEVRADPSRSQALAVIVGAWRVELRSGVVTLGGAVVVEAGDQPALVQGADGRSSWVPRGARWQSDTEARADRGAAQAPALDRPVPGGALLGERDGRRDEPQRRAPTPREEAATRVAGPRPGAEAVGDARSGPALGTDRTRVGVEPAPSDVTPPIAEARGSAGRSELSSEPLPPRGPVWDEEAAYRRARAERDVTRAVRIYDEVVAHGGALAEVSAVQAAEAQLRAGSFVDALRRFELAVARWPAGALAPEARLGAIECLVRLGRSAEARRGLDAIIAADPAHAESARFLRAELLRRAGRCDAAVEDYRAVTSGRRGDDAAFHLAGCLLADDEDAGQRALEVYLERYPGGRHAAEARGRLATPR